MDLDLDRWARQFPFVVDARRCDCGGLMETDWVHDPHTQEHFRGVEAWVCQDCGHAERKNQE